MKTYIFIPPVKRPVGGVAVLYQIASHLDSAGFEVFLVPREGHGPSRPQGTESLPEAPWRDLALTREDVWLAPEGWVNALAPGLKAGARCLVYCQNWAYLFSALPAEVDWRMLKVSFLAVSQPVAWFIEKTTGARCPILRPGLDLSLFRPPEKKPSGPIRIAYMPRKNKILVEQVKMIFTARSALAGDRSKVRWIEISGVDQAGVAELLGSSHIFLASGFPEGCPLPPLEAMASGCLPVGFGGFGGWDYMRQASHDRLGGEFSPFSPWWPVRKTDWGGNGLWASDADVIGAALALEEAVSWWRDSDPRLAPALENCRLTAKYYSLAAQRDRVVELWRRGPDREAGDGA